MKRRTAAPGEGENLKKSDRKGRMVFADPTHRRVFILAVILAALALTILYLKLFYPTTLIEIRYKIFEARFSAVVIYNRVFLVLMILNFVKLFAYAVAAKKSRPRKSAKTPTVTAVIPAYNEEKTIADTVRSVLRSDYKKLDVIVVDDGSSDRTLEILHTEFSSDGRVTVLTQKNAGKSTALNNGIAAAKGELLLLLDADTDIAPDAVSLLAAHFDDPRTAAVSGNTRVGNVVSLITMFQRVEYIRDFNLIKNGMARFNAMAVVPGALGMWRSSAVRECGGFSTDTLGEDRDLTMALLKKGYKVGFEPAAFSETEAPHNLRNFMRQRFRWTYATLQCIRKYLSCAFNPAKKGLGLVLMPDLLVFQTVLPLVTTVGLIGNLFALNLFELELISVSYIVAVCTELILFLLAKRVTREKIHAYDLLAVIPQRIVYGVVCTFLLFKAVLYAFLGVTVLWNKVERRGKAVRKEIPQLEKDKQESQPD
ncbi:MAG: glycosyltransferase family 2 protein [Clostridia bacterium]|nr:glycosyltransferase family 2 protein [Clostridia bacterium]